MQEMNNTRGIYIENLTAEIFNSIDNVISMSVSDEAFMKAQEKVRKIIAREYVDIADQVQVTPKKKGPKPIRFTIG